MNKRVLKVIKACDIVLEVVDARNVDGTRSYELESKILRHGKSMIMVINKCDLSEPSAIPDKNHVRFSATEKMGTKRLREAIHMEMKRRGVKDAKIGVAGYANTGKSSVIIAMGGRAKASSTAGFTLGEQWTRISKNIMLLDSPGIIPMEEGETELVLKGAFDVTRLKDAEGAAMKLLSTLDRKKLVKAYGVEPFEDDYEQLEELAGKWFMLNKGAELDLDRASKRLIKDWQIGKLSK